MKLKLNQNLSTPKGRLDKGSIITISVDDNNMPLDRFWRNRIKDSEIDNCVEIITSTKKKK